MLTLDLNANLIPDVNQNGCPHLTGDRHAFRLGHGLPGASPAQRLPLSTQAIMEVTLMGRS